MNLTLHRSPPRGLAALRRIAARRPAQERCELCAAAVPGEHQHLVDPEKRRLLCTCDACAILFDDTGATRYRRVPRESRALAGLTIGDALWAGLGIPIGLAFLFRSSVSNNVIAVYPSPGGPAEVPVEAEVWSELAGLDPSLERMAADVEALLVNRIQGAREYFIVPIDQCYRLTGIIRTHWTGFSGGDRMWDELRLFFDGLRQRAVSERSAGHA